MTDHQKECAKFEDLSARIVKHIFKSTDAVITKTRENKDGGYDIVVKCSDGNKVQRVYFECKLRNKNMNLRDIAANIIIAYNEGAVAMVAFTNHNYSLQADEHLSCFFNKTLLNIKIIIGEEINRLVKKYKIPLSDALSKLIFPKRTNRNLDNTLLQIDFSEDNIYKQIVTPLSRISNINISDISDEKMVTVLTILRNGGLLAVSGVLGVGKRSLVEAAAGLYGGVSIWTDASLHQTQERILTDILLGIWGISVADIFEQFMDNHVDSIIERLSDRVSNPKILNILRRLLGDTRIFGINDEDYNRLICDYIVESLRMHRDSLNYLFVFESLAYAKDEIFVLLSYLIKKLSQQKMPCVIIQDTEEYAVQRTVDLQAVFGHLSNFVPLTVNSYTKRQAVDYIHTFYPEIPMFIAKEAVEHIGTRKANISLFLDYIQNMGISVNDYKRMAEELQLLQPNSVPTIMSKVLNYYRQKNAVKLFDMLYLLQGSVNEKLCEQMAVSVVLLEQLIRAGIISRHQGYYICANRVVYAIIEDWGFEGSPRLRRLAEEIFSVLAKEPTKSIDSSKAHLLRHMGKYEQSLSEMLRFINYLEDERQFEALILNCDTVIELYQKLNNPLKQIKWIIYQLNIMRIKKILLSPKAGARMKELKEALDKYEYLNPPHHYTMAYDFFIFMIDFKNGHYNTDSNNGLRLKQYYENTVNGVYTDNIDDWLGNICNRYVLCVKESMGYDAALTAYNAVRKALPESSQLWRGHTSHLACMSLHNAPDKAFEYYEEIINSFHKKKGIYSLPFHEYVDRAMSKLLSGDISAAERLARYAIDVCEANAVYDERGRGLNILGCVLVCRGRVAEAKALFKESFEILKVSGYKLFSWRSQLNYIHTALDEGGDIQLLSEELEDAYKCFLSLHSTKLSLLLTKDTEKIEQSRDYHALLAFALYRSKINKCVDGTAEKDFNLGEHLKRYKNDLHTLLNSPASALPNSTFYIAGMIMAVG